MGSSKSDNERRFFDVRTSKHRSHFAKKKFQDLLRGADVIDLKPKFRMRHPFLTAAGILAAVFLVVLGIRQISTRAEVSDFYPSTCLGNWQDPANAAGQPETMGTNGAVFSQVNSAIFNTSGTQIFCGGFVPPNLTSSGTITNVGLTLVWQVGDTPIPTSTGAPAVTSGGGGAPAEGTVTSTSSGASTATTTPADVSSTVVTPTPTGSDAGASTSTSANMSTSTPPTPPPATTTTEAATPAPSTTPTVTPTVQPDAPAPAPAPVPSDTSDAPSPSTFAPLKNIFAFFVSRAFADAASSGVNGANDSTTIIIAPPITATLSPVSPSSTATPSAPDASSTVPAPAPDENFLQISYSTDGSTWIPIQKVSENDWQNLTITLPITDWGDLSKLQVRVAAIPTSLAVLPPVYLDGMLLEAHYTVTPFVTGTGTSAPTTQDQNPSIPVVVTPPQQFAPQGSSTDFSATEAPTFNFDLNNLPAPATTTPASSAPQSFNDHQSGVSWGDFFYSFLDHWKGRAEAQTVKAPPVPTPQNPVVAEIDDPSGQPTNFQPVIATVNDQLSVGLPEPSGDFTPGRYTLKMWILRNGVIYATENSFTWGVLVVNFDKSIYSLNDTARIGMGVLTDQGHTLCGALLAMTVTAPDGVVHNFSTANGTIKQSVKCGEGTVTNNPDYAASLTANQIGAYHVSVTATTGNGTRTITDRFEVQDPPLFDVARNAPTRIFPPVPYSVALKINANANFNGNITETVPASFGVTGNFSQQSSNGTMQTLTWPAKLKKGDSMTLDYTFKAPNVSPELYKLGPLQIGTWEESRQWQIAADAITNIQIVIISTASTTWTVPNNWTASNTIEVVGGGGNGVGGSSGTGAGGGGGGYSESVNQTLTPGATIGIHVGAVASDTWVCNATSNCATIAGTAVIAGAKGGTSAAGTTAGNGGATSTAVALGAGAVKFKGGNGASGGGGGGAASKVGSGGNAAGSTGGSSGSGVAGGSGGNTCNAGTNGTEWGSSPAYGSGSGGGGKTGGSTAAGCAGGTYGAAGGTGNKNTTPQGGQQGIIVITYTQSGITIGDGSQPAPVAIGPGANATTSAVFTLATNFGTSSITNVTTTLSTVAGVGLVQIADASGSTIYGSSANFVASSLVFGSTTLGIPVSGMNISTSTTSFTIIITPKNATSMPAVPGATYAVTSTVVGWVDSKGLATGGANTTSSVISIDNQSPADVTNASGTAGNGQVALSWTNPSDSDFAQTMILRTTSSVTTVTTTTYSNTTPPEGIASDGTNMWVADNASAAVTKISPTGTMTTYAGTGVNPWGIAFDGTNMWTANFGDNSVTKVSPTGATTTFSGTGAAPRGIAFDGTNMWTANFSSSSVTKVSPTGTMTTYAGTGVNPWGIAFDGTNMWTVNIGDSSVTKVSPTGTMTTYTGTDAYPDGIAFDGTNMWTANSSFGSVTKVSPTGATTTFSGTGAAPRGIAFDGTNMWTANQGDGSFTVISPTGIMETYSGVNGTLEYIALDGTSTNNMWATSYNTDNILKITRRIQFTNTPPTEGATYTVGQTIGSSTVACVVASSTSNCTDSGLVNGVTYYYEIFTADNYHNYSIGAAPSGSPFTPSAGATGPNLSNMALNGGSAINLVPNATTTISVVASTTANGSPLASATGTIYRTSLGPNCTANNRNCYQIPSSSCIFSGSTSTVTCSAPLWYFADSTGNASSSFPSDSWTAAITLTDQSGATSTATSSIQNVNVLTAINVTTSSINYGTLSPNTNTGSANQTVTVQNAGNSSTTVQVSGTAFKSGANTFATSSQHYATSSFTFGNNEQLLSDVLTTVSGFILPAPTTTSAVQGDTRWGEGVPFGISAGTYTATTTFSSLFSN